MRVRGKRNHKFRALLTFSNLLQNAICMYRIKKKNHKFRDGAKSENLGWQVVMQLWMQLPSGALYSDKICMGVRPPCPPASAIPVHCWYNVSSLLLDITYACLHCTMMSLRRLLSSIAAFLLVRDVAPWWMRYFRRLLRLSKSWELVMAFDRASTSAAARLEMMYEVEKSGHSKGNFMRDKSTLFPPSASGLRSVYKSKPLNFLSCVISEH